MNLTAWIGLGVMIASETATLARIEPFWSWNTPIAWTGFILFADGIVWKARRNSWIRSNGREFVLLALASIPLWVVFEGYDRLIRNWYYTGLPENIALRLFGYAWSFATIWPAIFEGAELVAVFRAAKTGPAEKAGAAGGSSTATGTSGMSDVAATYRASRLSRIMVIVGAVMLVLPLVVPAQVAVYMAAPVWLGFIFLLDPLNAGLGAESLGIDLLAGESDRLINLALSGLLCGVLWEFWNYWAAAKWHYTVPIMYNLKLFEMPIPGYLGFPAFAIECFTMYVFARALIASVASAFTASGSSPARTHRTQLGRMIAL